MARVGLYTTFLGLVDKDQKLISGTNGLSETGVIEITTQQLGAKTANITNVEGSSTIIYGNNEPVDVSISKGNPSVELDWNNLPFDVLQKVIGRTSDGKGGYTKMGGKPRVALLIASQTLDRANFIFYGFGNGIMSQTTINNATDTDAEQRQDDSLTYTALACDAFQKAPIKTFTDLDDSFDKKAMFTQVFGGGVEPADSSIDGVATAPGSSASTGAGSAANTSTPASPAS